MRVSPENLAAKAEPGVVNNVPTRDVRELFASHDDRVGIIVGSGPSLRGFRFEDLNDSRFCVFGINEEPFNNRDKYIPDYWIFSDDHVGVSRADEPLPPRMRVLTREANVFKLRNGRPAVWSDRMYSYQATCQANWSVNCDWFPLSKTTATAATGIAVRMGFKKIILLGIDCFASKSLGYYHDGRPKRSLKVEREDGDLYQTIQHKRMIDSWRVLAEGLRRYGWSGQIYQTSLASPVTFWPKKTWVEAVNA